MTNKTEQLNLRISSDLKDQLSSVAKEQGLSLSNFIRQTLEHAILSEKPKPSELNWKRMEERLMYAAANIVSIDTGLPLDQCLGMTIKVQKEMDVDFLEIPDLPRKELEEKYSIFQSKMQQNLGISDHALTFLNIMLSTLNSIRYDDQLFDLSPMSIRTLEQLRKLLQA